MQTPLRCTFATYTMLNVSVPKMSDQDKPDGDEAMKKLDNLVDKLFSVVKKDVEEVKEVAEEAVDEILKPEESSPDE
jgi:hypothetical protein